MCPEQTVTYLSERAFCPYRTHGGQLVPESWMAIGRSRLANPQTLNFPYFIPLVPTARIFSLNMPVLTLLRNAHAAAQSIRESWQRTFLSSLGILVGTMAIVLLVSIAIGVREDVSSQVRDLGVNVLVVIPGRIEDGTFNPNLGGTSYLKEIDATRLKSVPGVIRAEPFTFVGGGIRRGKLTATPLLVATTPGWFKMHTSHLKYGRVFEDRDDHDDVVILGVQAETKLFPGSSALGQTVTVNQRVYRVIGVINDGTQKQSLFSMGSLSNLVYLSFHRLKSRQPDLSMARIMVQISPDAEPKQLVKQLETVLGKRLDRQQYQVLTQEDLLGLVYRISGILTWLLTGLTSIALFVGGVGIMAIMLMSVVQRSKEIGIRKTVGARRRDIVWQFLFEAVFQALAGGGAGLCISLIVDIALRRFTPIKPIITPGTVALSLGTSLIIGVIFGILPALRAGSKDPVEAMRNE